MVFRVVSLKYDWWNVSTELYFWVKKFKNVNFGHSLKKQYPGLSDVNFKKCECIWTLHIHVCSSKSVEKYRHILLCASYMEKWFCVYKLPECKRFRNLPVHKMRCHKCTIGTGCFIYINVMWPWRALNQAVFMIC